MRKMAIGVAAAATALLVWFAPDEEGLVVSPAAANTGTAAPHVPNRALDGTQDGAQDSASAPPAAQPGPAPAEGETAGGAIGVGHGPAIPPELQIQRRVAGDEPGNLFAGRGWLPEAPLKPAAARVTQDGKEATPKGGAAALPFQVLGHFVEDGKTAWFLQLDEQNIVARVGDKVGDSYRLDAADDGALTFTYLPLNQQHTLATGDTN